MGTWKKGNSSQSLVAGEFTIKRMSYHGVERFSFLITNMEESGLSRSQVAGECTKETV